MSTEHVREDFDRYEEYALQFDPMMTDREARRKRKPKPHHVPKKTREDIINEVADPMEYEAGFVTTYQPSRYESGWLMRSLRGFYEQAMITDVLAIVKGGKEASVYVCEADETLEREYAAVKVYRPSKFRALTNDKMYREGRITLDSDGHDVMGSGGRDKLVRAMGKKTAFGRQVAHTSWLMHEYLALEVLFEAGLPVPEPIQVSENAILMSYHGDRTVAAPMLNSIRLEKDAAERHFDEVMHSVEVMLAHGIIHGDLSAYNILYEETDAGSAITIIDFPQVVDIRANTNAAFILARDITRVCEYFTRQGVDCDAKAISANLWERYLEVDADILAADMSRREESVEELWESQDD